MLSLLISKIRDMKFLEQYSSNSPLILLMSDFNKDICFVTPDSVNFKKKIRNTYVDMLQ